MSRRTNGKTAPLRLRRRLLFGGILSLLLWLTGLPGPAWGADVSKPIDYGEDGDEDPLLLLPAPERAARRSCTLCHLFVEPTMLTRDNLETQILPRMKVRLGVAKPDFASSPEGEIIRARRIYTEHPLVPVEDWPLIEEFYLKNAPEKPLPQGPKPEITIGLKLFDTVRPRWRFNPPSTTLVKLSEKPGRIYVGDDRAKSLALLDAEGSLMTTIPLGNVPVDLVEREEGLYVTCIGSFIPSEIWRAELLLIPRKGDGFGEKQVLLRNLPRASQTVFADFNGDGREDFAMCMFGNLTGRFSWFENLGEGRYREHVLTDHTGAMNAAVHDFNGDGKPDLAVLFAQDLEQLMILLNDGKGGFSGTSVFQRPPVWGHSYFELADFNQDGRMDLIVCNGDNGEYDSPTKNYHGIRILLNRGDLDFEEAFFYPMNGCYRALARDFDADGDLDLAAISFFPDYALSPKESFVYLENVGGNKPGEFKFETSTFRECISGRWIVGDVGDLDGDGDPDIVLGSYIHGPTSVPKFLLDIWEPRGFSIQILRNRMKPQAAGRPPLQ